VAQSVTVSGFEISGAGDIDGLRSIVIAGHGATLLGRSRARAVSTGGSMSVVARLTLHPDLPVL
jgi:hypothetical protein